MTASSGDGGSMAAEIVSTTRVFDPPKATALAAPANPPKSATVSWINFCGFGGFLVATLIVPRLGLPAAMQIILMLATPAAIIVALEALFVKDRIPFLPLNRSGYISAPTGVPALRRKYLKLLGLVVSLAGVAAVFWLFPLYRGGGAAQLIEVVSLLWLPFVALAPIYVWYVDNRMEEPEDGYFHLGLLVSGAWNIADRDILKQHALQWGVKAFFLPLMIGFLATDLSWLGGNPVEAVLLPFMADPGAATWINIYEYLFRYAFLLDVTIASVGYVMTLKLFDAHLRSAEPTLLGWAVCLICYPPFWGTISTQFLHYDAGTPWGFWFESWPVVKIGWSVLIIACLSIYVWATIQFGVRFSNLTNRGILTNGPYRWLKHPAYLSKNISWWLVSVPFISGAGASEAIRMSLLLLAVNGIYYMRAKTEERHLANDPVYREYLAFMRDNDAFALVRRLARGVAGHPQPGTLRGK